MRLLRLVSFGLARVRVGTIFLVVCALHLAALAHRPADAARTENLAVGFKLGERGYLGDPFTVPTGPTAHVSPMYPMLVAAAYRVTRTEENAVTLLAVLGVFLTSLSAALLVPIARAMRLREGTGALAALVWALPLFAWVQLRAEHETVFSTAAVLVLILALFTLLERPGVGARAGGLLGAATGLGAHVTPLVLPMMLLAATGGIVARRVPFRRIVPFVAAFVLALAFAVAPYTIRNHRVMGSTFFIRDNFGLELAVSNSDSARATAEANLLKGAGMSTHPFASTLAARRMRVMGEVAYNRSRLREGVTWIRTHPTAFLGITVERAGYLLLPYSRRSHQRLIAAALSIGFLLGLGQLWRRGNHATVATLAGAFAGYEVIYLIVQHDIRYIYPMLWIQSLVAAAFVIAVADRVNQPLAVGDPS